MPTVWTQVSGGGSIAATQPGLIKVSANDSLAGDLESKLLTGALMSLQTSNDGANETRTINLDQSLIDLNSAISVSGSNVGIGVSNPADELDVSGNMRLRGTSTEDRRIEIGLGRTDNGSSFIDLISDTTYNNYGARFERHDTGPNTNTDIAHRGTGGLNLIAVDAGNVRVRTNNIERMRVDELGRVGIGVSNPAANVQVETSTNTNLAIVSSTSGVSSIDFGDSDDRNAGLIQYLNTDNAMTFRTSGSGEDMRIDSSGNVGIGLSNPQYKLDVNGTVNVTAIRFPDGTTMTTAA